MPDPVPSLDSAPRRSSGVGQSGRFLGGSESATPAQELLVTGGGRFVHLRIPGGMPPPVVKPMWTSDASPSRKLDPDA